MAYAAEAGCSRESLNKCRHQLREPKITSRVLIREDAWGNLNISIYTFRFFFFPKSKKYIISGVLHENTKLECSYDF